MTPSPRLPPTIEAVYELVLRFDGDDLVIEPHGQLDEHGDRLLFECVAAATDTGLETSIRPVSAPTRTGVSLGPVAPRILVVEDDDSIRETTRLVLEDEGYAVEEATTGEEGVARFDTRPADCVLLDIMLPDIDGFEACRALRRRSDVPIIMVTARSDTFDVVAGLEAGADDYVTKPFEPKELTARLRALLRRARKGAEPAKVIRLGDKLEVVPDEGVVRRNGEELHLTSTEFRLLCEMAAAPNRVFTREVLLSAVWGYDYFGDGKLVDVHVHRLRGKIEDDPAEPRHVVTVRGLGYKVVP